jgi:DNA gyrase/topoisomerase IV subunit A
MGFNDILLMSHLGQTIRLSLDGIPSLGRSTQGVRLMKLKKKEDAVSSFVLI